MNRYFNSFLLSDLLFGTSIGKYYRQYRDEEKLSRSEILDVQKNKLRQLLEFAVKNIPHYRDLNIHLNTSEDIIDQLKKFPVLKKKTINADLTRFHSETLNLKKITILNSGGSSGNPGKIYVNKNDHSKLRALIMILWENAGYQTSDHILQLGMTKTRSPIKKLKDLAMKVQYELAFNINDENVKKVLNKINPNHPTCFIGYASGLYGYARIAEKNKLDVKFKAVISLGDKMFDHYREKLEKTFHTRVYDTYGSNEGLIFGGQHRDGNYYLNETHVFTEIVDDNYQPVAPGQPGRILATCLDNFTMPLIRFDLGDIVALNDYSETTPLPFKTIKSILGRDVDIIKTRNGFSLIVHFFTAIMGGISEIDQFRVIQENIDHLTIEYIPGPGFKEKILQSIKDRILSELPPNEIEVVFKQVNSIPVSGSGKPQIIKSLIKN